MTSCLLSKIVFVEVLPELPDSIVKKKICDKTFLINLFSISKPIYLVDLYVLISRVCIILAIQSPSKVVGEDRNNLNILEVRGCPISTLLEPEEDVFVNFADIHFFFN